MRAPLIGALMAVMLTSPAPGAGLSLEKPAGTLRVATFNADMARKGAGVLAADIAKRDPQVLAVTEILQRVRPDIILLNEIDHDPNSTALTRFLALLREGTGDLTGLDYPHHFIAPSNTGVPSGYDLDGDGTVMDARDAWGFGRFPGQYAMALLSRVPLTGARTFRHQPWSSLPWAEQPMNPDGTPYYAPEIWDAHPFSSKSHWDIVAALPDGRTLHLLASHPTPPVFDGPENRNGLRNAAEIRFWADYVADQGVARDDDGTSGGLPEGAHFVILGDLNNDPVKGDGANAAIRSLTEHERVQDPAPTSPGAAEQGDSADTAHWPKPRGPGNLRVDYVLPSKTLTIAGSGVFWPASDDALARLVATKGQKRASSDHRLVWVDIRLEEP